MSVELIVVIDGKERPAWALKASDTLVATEYDADRQRMTLWLDSAQLLVGPLGAEDDDR